MENIFTSKEVDTLVEALETWERGDFSGRLMGSLLKGMIGKDAPQEVRDEWDKREREEKEKEEREARQRKDAAIMLKAKLVMMKQQRSIDESLVAKETR